MYHRTIRRGENDCSSTSCGGRAFTCCNCHQRLKPSERICVVWTSILLVWGAWLGWLVASWESMEALEIGMNKAVDVGIALFLRRLVLWSTGPVIPPVTLILPHGCRRRRHSVLVERSSGGSTLRVTHGMRRFLEPDCRRVHSHLLGLRLDGPIHLGSPGAGTIPRRR
jgi:hypothetical protein